MKIYTRTGDAGQTTSITGEKIKKSDSRIDAIGTVDELNSIVGLILESICGEKSDSAHDEIKTILGGLQHDLFTVGAEITLLSEEDHTKIKIPRLTEQHILDLERSIDQIQGRLTEQKSFLLPGGTAISAWLHFSRTVCRRAERDLVRLHETITIKPELLRYLNRLSDLLYVLARYANKEIVDEQQPIYRYFK